MIYQALLEKMVTFIVIIVIMKLKKGIRIHEGKMHEELHINKIIKVRERSIFFLTCNMCSRKFDTEESLGNH